MDLLIKRSGSGLTLAWEAAHYCGRKEMIELIKEKGALNHCNAWVSFVGSALGGHKELAMTTLPRSRNVDYCLASASRGGNKEIVEFILSKGVLNLSGDMENALKCLFASLTLPHLFLTFK